MPPHLIINADDFGLTPGINYAIAELHQAGVVTSATLMANGPAFEDAVALIVRDTNLGVGCHLVFVDGVPISPPESIPTLLGPDRKTFRPSLLAFAHAALRNTLNPDELTREAQAQIQKLQRAGIPVTHLDTHKHTHIFPKVLAPILRAAALCGISAIRHPFEPQWSAALAHAPLIRRLQLNLLRRFEPPFRQLTQSLAEQGYLPSGTVGIAATGTLTADVLRATLTGFVTDHDDGNVFELCCHPGHFDPALDAIPTRLRASRETEYRALLQVIPEYSRTPERLQLIHYGDLSPTSNS